MRLFYTGLFLLANALVSPVQAQIVPTPEEIYNTKIQDMQKWVRPICIRAGRWNKEVGTSFHVYLDGRIRENYLANDIAMANNYMAEKMIVNRHCFGVW